MLWNYSQLNTELINLAASVSLKNKVSGGTDDPCDTYVAVKLYSNLNQIKI